MRTNYRTDTVAQFVFAMIIEWCHYVSLHNESVKNGEWTTNPDFCFWKIPLIELVGKSIGIVEFGRIGHRIGELSHAFGLDVMAFDAVTTNPPDYQPFSWKDISEIFAEADIVSLHCPQTAENTGMVNAALFGSMKKDAFLINTSRGWLIIEQDLADARNNGRIAGAAVDVFSLEPIKSENPLLSAKNCNITPHIAWAALAARKRLMKTTAENVTSFHEGKPIHVVK